MSNNLPLDRIRRWPRWTIIPIGLVLAGLVVVLGLMLEPAGYALSPNLIEPTPTMPSIAYGEGHSESCHNCHFSLSALKASAADPGSAQAYLIEAESVVTPHGRLGCLACHGGDGEAQDKEAAHQGLVADMSAQDPEKCVICHRDLPDEIPGDRLRVPHGIIISGVEEGNPCDAECSDCHGGVGHGFDPVSGAKFCSMKVCLDCHEDLALEIQLADCGACHMGPHTVATSFACNDCHTSTGAWQQVSLDMHPMALSGRHGELGCFQCHQYPDFEGLSSACSDCHMSGHAAWGDYDCTSCHDPGVTWDPAASEWDGHVTIWDQYKGEHLKVTCNGCHFEGYGGLDPICDTCHAVPESHVGNRDGVECVNCHQADQPWDKLASGG